MNRKQAEWLQRELRAWEKEGLIRSEQAEKILTRPSYAEALSGAPPRTLNRLFAVLGGLLVGVGLILFFSSNWRAIPDAGKLAMIFGTLLAAHGMGYRLRFRERAMPGLAAGMFFLGAIAYGSGIFLVAQIYNLHAEWRTGVLLWFLGTLPLAYGAESRPVLWLSLGTLYLWLLSKFSFGEGMLVLQGLGAVLVLAAVRHWQPLERPRFAKIFFLLGAGTILYSTLVLTFGEAVEQVARQEFSGRFYSYFYTLLGLYAAVLVGIWLDRKNRPAGARGRLVLFLTLALAPAIFLPGPREAPAAYLVFTNLLLFGECVGLILFGIALRTAAYLNLGVTFFLVLVVARYFDSYWEYLPRSLLFIFGGVLLLGLGSVLEKKRRQWIAGFDAEESG